MSVVKACWTVNGKARALGARCLVFGGALLLSAPAIAEVSPRSVPAAQGSAAEQPAVEVIFTGFARRPDKSASIFVRMTGEVPVAVDRAGRRLTYRLAGAKLGVPNNANPLPTEHFGPPVSHVALVAGSAGVDLVIDLSGDETEPTHRVVTGSGLATLHVDLPSAP